MRSLVLIAILFCVAPLVRSWVEPAEIRYTHWPNGRTRSAIRVERNSSGTLDRHGSSLLYDEQGRVKVRGQFREDMREGRWTWFRPDGSVDAICDYSGDRGPYRAFHPDGSVKTVGAYDGDSPAGTWTEYFPSGRVRLRGDYVNGKREGEWVAFSDSDPPQSMTVRYRNGERIEAP